MGSRIQGIEIAMKNNIYKKHLFISITIVLILITSTFWSFSLLKEEKDILLYNNTRVLVNEKLVEIENGKYGTFKYPYAVVDLKGTVIYSDKELGFDSEVNLKEVLQFDRSFFKNNKENLRSSFVLEDKSGVKGFVIFSIPYREVHKEDPLIIRMKAFIPIVSALILTFALLLYQLRYLRKRILKPIDKICTSSKGIIEGNYNIEIRESLDANAASSEVGELCYSFELMRDELKHKLEQEERIKHSQKELIACISHDLKTPISSIKAHVEGIRDGIVKDEEKLKRYIQVISNKTNTLTDLIDDLLEHSKVELNVLSIIRKEMYFNEFFNKYTEELSLEFKKIDHKLTIDNHIPNMLVSIDEKRIAQVIGNLVENSIKYANSHVNIKIETKLIKDFIEISIEDNGRGIDYSDIPYVFDKFYRAEKSRSSSIPGSGLGLSICKYIIEKHGGEIVCQSKVGIGTKFTFTLPI